MAVTKLKKVAILDELNNTVAVQKSVVLLSAKDAKVSLNGESNFKLRRSSRDQGVAIQVVKNTLIRKTFSDVPEIAGPTYLAYMVDFENTDEVSMPKIMVDLIKKDFKDNFQVFGSIVNGEFYDADKTVALSKVPTKDTSLGMIAGAINSVIAKIAIGIKEVPSGVARGVKAYSETI